LFCGIIRCSDILEFIFDSAAPQTRDQALKWLKKRLEGTYEIVSLRELTIH